MLGPMDSITNLTKLCGQRRPMSPLLITSIQSSTGKELTLDSTQLLHNRIRNLSNSPQFNLISLNTKLETMPGLMPKLMTPMKMNGKLTSNQLVLIIWIQLKIHLLKLKTLMNLLFLSRKEE